MIVPITTIPAALAYCESAGLEPRTQHGGLGETSYWVYINHSYHSFWSDSQFLGWLNAWIRLGHLRLQAGWERHRLFGWIAPDGTPEYEWAESNHPFPEDEGYAAFASTYRPFHELVG